MSDQLALAGRFRRLLATLIDMILVPALSLVLVAAAGVMEDAEDYQNVDLMILWIFLLAVVSYLILNGYTLWRRGQTLGKLALGIAIVPAADVGVSGEQAGFKPAPLWKLICLRALFFPLLYLSLPALLIPTMLYYAILPLIDQVLIFGKQRRCLHDLVAGTAVVRVRPG